MSTPGAAMTCRVFTPQPLTPPPIAGASFSFFPTWGTKEKAPLTFHSALIGPSLHPPASSTCQHNVWSFPLPSSGPSVGPPALPSPSSPPSSLITESQEKKKKQTGIHRFCNLIPGLCPCPSSWPHTQNQAPTYNLW